MIGVMTSESGMWVLVIKGDKTYLEKNDDGKTNEGNGRGILKDCVSSMVSEGMWYSTEIAGIETSGQVKEW